MKLPFPIRPHLPRRSQRGSGLRGRAIRRRLAFEQLEDRQMLSGLPFGAASDDTAEYMLGDVLVTLVLMESDGTIDVSTEDWTPADIQAVKDTVAEGLNWWVDALALEGSAHSLSFIIDDTFADSPVPTSYEPISQPWDYYQYWVGDFLDYVGYDTPAGLGDDILAFNHAQRLAHGTDWSFTIFVANSTNDPDDRFELGHEFAGSFAFAGGLFFVAPSQRPASTFAHETGHIFYAKDEYPGGASYFDCRGYYNTQNLNAWDDNPDPGSRVDSIMSSGAELLNAYTNYLISPSAKQMIGWLDSDGDGVFDVLDVAHTLRGSGAFDPHTQTYRFLGESSVQTLPNLNPSGQGNDITINEISRAEYRIDGGDWQTADSFHTATAQLDLTIPLPAGAQQIEIRTIDDQSGVTSSVFNAAIGPAESTELPGINGFVWVDVDGDGLREVGEPGVRNWTVVLKQPDGTPLPSPQVIEPDDFTEGTPVEMPIAGTTLSVETIGGFDSAVGVALSPATSTGDKVFAYQVGSNWSTLWTPESRRLRIDFDSPVAHLQIDVVADSNGDRGRLEVYDENGQLLARYTSEVLSSGQSQTLQITRPAGDIAYALVGGHADADVLLDNLQVGISPETQTDDLGGYCFAGLDPGTYCVELSAPQGWSNTSPQEGETTVALSPGEVSSGADFGVYPTSAGSLWQNPANPLDVDDDGMVWTHDVLWIANELYFRGSRQLPAPTVPPNAPAPYLDTNGDGYISPVDALLLIHHFRSSAGDAASGESLSGPVAGGATAGDDIEPETLAAGASDSGPPALLAEALAESLARPDRCGALPILQPRALPRDQAGQTGQTSPPDRSSVQDVRPPRALVEYTAGVPVETDQGLPSILAGSTGKENVDQIIDGLFRDLSWLECLVPIARAETPVAAQLGV